jgi:hypothetical protein
MLRKSVEYFEWNMSSRMNGRRYLREIPLINSKYERRDLQVRA